MKGLVFNRLLSAISLASQAMQSLLLYIPFLPYSIRCELKYWLIIPNFYRVY